VDPAQVEQVIMNLAVNARDAMPTGGRILFATDNFDVAKPHEFLPQGRYVRLAISDTGCGMTEEVRSRLFEPFFTTKDVGKGTGLGLPMVYGFVKQSGGHITVSSEVGVGTTFEILLPRTDLPNLPEDEAPLPCPPARPGDTVLLAEDDAAVRQFTTQSLRAQGYTVLEAVNGQAAIQMAELHDGPIHLLMTDVVMPGMGGRPLAEALRARLPNIKVLYVSGYLDDDLLRHGVSNKIDNFVHKPFTHTDLCRAIHELLAETG
jgi:CheY-like chemotaxis protein